MSEMWPTSVDIPVAVTSRVAAPRVTCVFMNAISTRSPRAASAATASVLLGTGVPSPLGPGRPRPVKPRFGGPEGGRPDDPATARKEAAGLDIDDVAWDKLL